MECGWLGSYSVRRFASCIDQNYEVGEWAMEWYGEEMHYWTSIMHALREARHVNSFLSAGRRALSLCEGFHSSATWIMTWGFGGVEQELREVKRFGGQVNR